MKIFFAVGGILSALFLISIIFVKRKESILKMKKLYYCSLFMVSLIGSCYLIIVKPYIINLFLFLTSFSLVISVGLIFIYWDFKKARYYLNFVVMFLSLLWLISLVLFCLLT